MLTSTVQRQSAGQVQGLARMLGGESRASDADHEDHRDAQAGGLQPPDELARVLGSSRFVQPVEQPVAARFDSDVDPAQSRASQFVPILDALLLAGEDVDESVQSTPRKGLSGHVHQR